MSHSQTVNEATYLFQRGVDCATGLSGARDYVAAHKWFNLAASAGDRRAREARVELALLMSAGEIAEAQREAREYRLTH